MTDLRELFPILEDQSTKEGKGWSLVQENSEASSAQAGAVLTAKDESGYLKYIPIVDGKVAVTFQSPDIVHKFANGMHAGDNSNYQNIATISLVNNKKYTNLGWVASCFMDAHFEIVKIDDVGGTPTETKLVDILVAAGCTTSHGSLDNLEFTAGSTGTCNLVIRGKNLKVASKMRATITITENS